MKKQRFLAVCVLIIALVVLVVVKVAHGEDGSLIQWSDQTMLCVVRPQIQLNARKGGGNNGTLYFGEEVTLLSHEEEWCKVRTKGGKEGWVDTCYLGEVLWKIYLDNRVSLSYKPGLTDSDFGSAAGGKRSKEVALVLAEANDYLYVVTEEGCSGFVYRYNPGVTYYDKDESNPYDGFYGG